MTDKTKLELIRSMISSYYEYAACTNNDVRECGMLDQLLADIESIICFKQEPDGACE